MDLFTRCLSRISLASIGVALGITSTAEAAPDKPNVVVIMVDDMGFSDLSCFGSEIPTPNLDKLAAQGLRMNQFYNVGRCCPTRASLLTGNYNHFVGVPGMEGPGAKYDPQTGQRIGPRGSGAILRESPSLGEVLRHNGYQTYISGKWHVGEVRQDQWPLQRGFDKFFGTVRGATPNKFTGAWVIEGNQEIPKPVPEGWYIGNAVGSKAIEYVKGRDPEKPFFLYYTPLEPHWPWRAPDSDVEPFKGKYDAGYEVLRAQRHQRAMDLGVIPADTKLEPRDPFLPTWEEMRKRPEGPGITRAMEQHAGMVKNIDDNVGRLVAELDREGVLDDTLILFCSDNGGEKMLGAFSWAWPTLINSPFRWHKTTSHEGGIASPFIVRWPKGGIPAGVINKGQVGHVMDILPTLLEATGGEFPAKNLRLDTIKPEGKSLLAAWRNPDHAEPRLLFWEHIGQGAVRDGKWKLVRLYNIEDFRPVAKPDYDVQQGRERTGKWELYDMEADRTEMNDLASQMPEKVAELSAKYDAWFARMEYPPREEFFKKKVEALRARAATQPWLK